MRARPVCRGVYRAEKPVQAREEMRAAPRNIVSDLQPFSAPHADLILGRHGSRVIWNPHCADGFAAHRSMDRPPKEVVQLTIGSVSGSRLIGHSSPPVPNPAENLLIHREADRCNGLDEDRRPPPGVRVIAPGPAAW